ncbi:hypothetical protein K474DRAFT_1704157 [Panus rudis PR-1116 ss-1]|nr:hypothetical protein K474DRAFT_1704157 [Panus rudis PR-1116 ss-1]
MPTNDNTVLLNNYLQSIQKLERLHWRASSTGPAHAPQWTATCILDGQEIGTGIGPSKNLAKDAAAKEALKVLTSPPETAAEPTPGSE